MRSASLLLLLVSLQCHVARLTAVPAGATGPVLLGEVDIAVQDDSSDEITTEEPYLKKCIVDGNAYSHSQTIPSYDPNSHCLCVAGEVYCWWQNYKPGTDSPTGSTLSLSTTTTTRTSTAATATRPTTRTTTNGGNYPPTTTETSTDVVDVYEASGEIVDDSPSSGDQQEFVQVNTTFPTTTKTTTTTKSSSTNAPRTVCLVMGREYRAGEALPHSTGNCVECSCGAEGRVVCSPKDCVGLRPAAPDIPETPDGEFEVFDDLERGLDETF